MEGKKSRKRMKKGLVKERTLTQRGDERSRWENREREKELNAEKIAPKEKLYRIVANYLISDVKGLLGENDFFEKDFKITPENFAEFIKMIYKNDFIT